MSQDFIDQKFIRENGSGQFAVECQIKIAANCIQAGDFCDSRDEAREWVEEDCWIYSGEGYICTQCNEQIHRNIAQMKYNQNFPPKD